MFYGRATPDARERIPGARTSLYHGLDVRAVVATSTVIAAKIIVIGG
jgi:hypothetical protein